MQKIRLSLFIFCVGFLSSAFATIQQNLEHFYSRMGGSVNATPGGAYQGQMSGHYTLGSVTMRSHANTTHFASSTAPALRGGCSGIDLHTGSFSFIRSVQLKRMLQDITTSGMNYAFMIGFEQLCPMCKKTMDQLNKLAQEINQWNINACDTSAAIMGGILPRTQAVQNYVCSNYGANSGMLADYAAAKQGCGSGGRSTDILERARTGDSVHALSWKDVLTDKGNLAWMILSKEAIFVVNAQGQNVSGSDTELNELMMTLSGSIIVREEAGTQKLSYLASKASDPALINALMFGGATNPAQIYACNDLGMQGCLQPTYTKRIIIPENRAFVGRVKRLLIGIKTKLIDPQETAFTPEEMDLINKTKSIPLVKAINVQSAYAFASEIINIEDYAALIARDLLEDYLLELLDLVRMGTHKVSADERTLKQFMVGIREARERVRHLTLKDTQQFNQAMMLVQKIQVLEKMLAGEFSADMARTLDWAVGRR